MIDRTDPYQIEPTPDQIRRMRHDEGLADRDGFINVWEAILDEVWDDDPICHPVRHCSELDENDPDSAR